MLSYTACSVLQTDESHRSGDADTPACPQVKFFRGEDKDNFPFIQIHLFQFIQIHLIIHTNTFNNSGKYIWQSRQ